MLKQENIRNFSIIAHIDHGKSTLADRLLEVTNTVSKRELKTQMMDTLDLEQERGITIKLQSARMNYVSDAGEKYLLNLIDTPGHVDFSYEVSRSLAACEGALLVVDATQGIEAQTMANIYLALDNNLQIIPVINKIDLPSSDVEKVRAEIRSILGPTKMYEVSAKTGVGVHEILEAIVAEIPPPDGKKDDPLKALVFDSFFDTYQGVIILVRLFDGSIKVGDEIHFMKGGTDHEITEIGYFTPKRNKTNSLVAGEVGYLIGNIKTISNVNIGDTVTGSKNKALKELPGYKEPKSMVFCGLYPIDGDDYGLLRDALEKLKLNDSSLRFEPETSTALGFGFRCGFLGLLHSEVVKERLFREYNVNLIATSPSVVYQLHLTNGEVLTIDNPSKYPARAKIDKHLEPMVKATIIMPSEYVGPIMDLCNKRRGKMINMEYMTETRVLLYYKLPLNEILIDFFNQLKSLSKGYASLDYEFAEYEEAKLVKVDILLNSSVVDAFSFITHVDNAYYKGREIVEKLRKFIPRHMFEIPVQASIGSKVIARENIKAMRKNVLAKCYGGDISRKRKLLEKQKEGKKKMKSIGNVDIPEEAFLSILTIEDQ